MPPSKQPLRPPPLPPPKPTLKPLPPAPVPPPKPHSPTSLNAADQPQHTNGVHGPPSPLRSPDNGEAAGEDGEDGELEVGSMVEVNDPPLFGVIRWIGRISGISAQVAGIELVRSPISSDSHDVVCDSDCKTNKPAACVRTRSCLRGRTAATSVNVTSVVRPTRGCSSSYATAGGTRGSPPPRRPSTKWSAATP